MSHENIIFHKAMTKYFSPKFITFKMNLLKYIRLVRMEDISSGCVHGIPNGTAIIFLKRNDYITL